MRVAYNVVFANIVADVRSDDEDEGEGEGEGEAGDEEERKLKNKKNKKMGNLNAAALESPPQTRMNGNENWNGFVSNEKSFAQLTREGKKEL